MKKTMIALIALGLLACTWAPADAADKVDHRALGKAWRSAKQALGDGEWPMDDTLERLSACEGLVDYKTSIEMLEFYEPCDTAWSGGEVGRLGRKGKGDRPPESYRIATAILDTVRTMKVPSEALKFAEKGDLENSKDWPLRVRMAMMDAITNNVDDSEEILAWVIGYAKNREMDADIRILAVGCLDEVGNEEGVFASLMACIMDPSWRIREIAVEAMVGVADNDEDKVIVALIDRLSQEQGRLRKTISDALTRITGADCGTNSDDWVDWFKNKKREEAGLPPKTGKQRGSEVIFKTVSFSNRYVFVLDTSISMTKPMKPPEKEKIQESMKQDENDKRDPLPWDSINSLADVAREEIIRSLKVMDPEITKFTLVAFDEEVQVWKEELVDADKKNIAAAAKWLRGMKGGKKTDVYGSLDAVFDLCETIAGADVGKRKKKKKKKKGGVVTGEKHVDEGLPDTVFFYSDGFATRGKYAGRDKEWQSKKLSQSEQAKLYAKMMDDMVVEIKDRNRIARLTINCIGVGDRQDSRTMGRISSRTGGKYRNISK